MACWQWRRALRCQGGKDEQASTKTIKINVLLYVASQHWPTTYNNNDEWEPPTRRSTCLGPNDDAQYERRMTRKREDVTTHLPNNRPTTIIHRHLNRVVATAGTCIPQLLGSHVGNEGWLILLSRVASFVQQGQMGCRVSEERPQAAAKAAGKPRYLAKVDYIYSGCRFQRKTKELQWNNTSTSVYFAKAIASLRHIINTIQRAPTVWLCRLDRGRALPCFDQNFLTTRPGRQRSNWAMKLCPKVVGKHQWYIPGLN